MLTFTSPLRSYSTSAGQKGSLPYFAHTLRAHVVSAVVSAMCRGLWASGDRAAPEDGG